MSDNPFAAPTSDSAAREAIGVRSKKAADVLKVAKYQKGIMLSILIYLAGIGVVVGLVAVGTQAIQAGKVSAELVNVVIRGVQLGILVAVIFGAVCVLLMSMKVYHPVVGVFMAVLAIIPILGLLVLVSMNGRANKILKDNGLRVGLLGANLAEARAKLGEA